MSSSLSEKDPESPPRISTESQQTSTRDDEPGLPPLEQIQSHLTIPQSLLHEAAFVAVLCMAQLMTQAGLGQTIAPLNIIGESFGTRNPGELSWFASAYSLTVGAFILIAGRLGDIYGHKKLFIAGFMWFGLWSLLAGFSVYLRSTPIFFECCRAFQGIGPAFVLPNALAILGRTYPQGRRKEMVFCLFGATAPTGFVLGATFSSLFAELAWWPWAFWVTGIVCFALSVASIFIVPHTPSPEFKERDFISMANRVDILGSVVGVVALVLINFAWNQGPVVGWTTPYTYALLIVGFVLVGIFAFIESKAEFPLIPMYALTTDTAFVLGCMAAGWSSFGIWVFYTWRFLQEVRHVSPLLACAQFVPCMISGAIAAIVTGIILHRTPPSVVMMISMLAFTIGGTLVATAPPNQIYWAQIFVAIVVMPWGMDMSFPAATILLSDRMGKEHQGVAGSLVNTVVNYSISIGLGFAGTIESQKNPAGTSEHDLLKGYRSAMYMGIGLSTLGVFVAFTFGLSHVVKHKRGKKEKPVDEV